MAKFSASSTGSNEVGGSSCSVASDDAGSASAQQHAAATIAIEVFPRPCIRDPRVVTLGPGDRIMRRTAKRDEGVKVAVSASMPKAVARGIDDLQGLVNEVLGPSEWREVTQEMINDFAELSGDDQWIHTDVERAKSESPFGTTIAH